MDGWTETVESGEPAERDGSNGTDFITLFLREPLNTLQRTGDADLRFYVKTVQDG